MRFVLFYTPQPLSGMNFDYSELAYRDSAATRERWRAANIQPDMSICAVVMKYDIYLFLCHVRYISKLSMI